MKILKKGKMPTHKFVCDTCGTKFIANFDEYETSVHDTLNDGVNGICSYCEAVVYKCKCPVCDTTIKDVIVK